MIVGADFELLEADDRRSQITFLAQNHAGYRNLTVLISRAYQEGQILAGHCYVETGSSAQRGSPRAVRWPKRRRGAPLTGGRRVMRSRRSRGG